MRSSSIGHKYGECLPSTLLILRSHLLLTYPSPSNALEAFILSRAEESTHSAMLVSHLI